MIKNLKQLRTIKGISQKQLAEIMSLSQQSINKYENHGVEPDIDTLIKLADYFNTSVDYLIGHTNINHKIEPVNFFDLNNDETELLTKYRNVSDVEKASIQLVLSNYIK